MPRVIKLKYPIPAHGQMVDELTVPDRLTVGHMMQGDPGEGEIGMMAGVIAGACAIPLSSVRMLDVEDFNAVAAQIFPLSRSGGQDGTPPLVTSPTSIAGLRAKRRRSRRRNSTGFAGMPKE